MDKQLKITRDKIVEILGLEIDPDGAPDQLLIRNERGRVEQGIDFSTEVDQLIALLTAERQAGARAEVNKFIGKYSRITPPIKDSPMELTDEAITYDKISADIAKYGQSRLATLNTPEPTTETGE